jgi:hypothetical protein
MLAVLAVACTFAAGGQLPDRHCTPGDWFNRATAAQICTPGWAGRRRNVSARKRAAVWRRYGFDYLRRYPRGWEVDHLVPLELGGSNSVRDLWPERFFRRKDRLETRLHAEVCAGHRSLRSAQRAIARNWLAAY